MLSIDYMKYEIMALTICEHTFFTLRVYGVIIKLLRLHMVDYIFA